MPAQDVMTASPTPISVPRVPLWLSVVLTVAIAVPFGLWLGKFNFTLWVCFIVWAEYFALGTGMPAVLLILKTLPYAAIFTGVNLAIIPLFKFLPSIVTTGDLSVIVVLSLGLGFLVYTMKWARAFQEGTLPFFNGITIALGTYFSGSYPHLGPEIIQPIIASVWAVLMACFGIALGWLTVALQFSQKQH